MSSRIVCAVWPTAVVALVCCALRPHCPQLWAPAGRPASSRPAIVLHTYFLARNENIIVCPPSQVLLGKAKPRTDGIRALGAPDPIRPDNPAFGDELAK